MPQLGLKLNRCPWSVLDYLQYPAACPAPCKNIQCSIQYKIRKDLLIAYNKFSQYTLIRYKQHSSFLEATAQSEHKILLIKKKKMNVYSLQSSIPLTLNKIQK